MRRVFERIVILWASALAACSGEEASPTTEEADLRQREIEPTSKVELPLREVSGLGRRRAGGGTQYLAIGDADATLVTFEMSGARPTSIATHDLSGAVGRSGQWEAVAGDGSGKVFFLEEKGNRIVVLDEALSSTIHTTKLDLGFEDESSGGEGMLLLSNGHVLVAKEKDPPSLLELAPRGEGAKGFSAELALRDRVFPLPRGASSELELVHTWRLGASESESIGDISDLALDDEDRILLLSDQGRAIVRIERTLDPTEDRIDAKQIYKLPRAVEKPEGLVLAGGRPIVAIDQPSARRDSLFVFERLPDR